MCICYVYHNCNITKDDEDIFKTKYPIILKKYSNNEAKTKLIKETSEKAILPLLWFEESKKTNFSQPINNNTTWWIWLIIVIIGLLLIILILFLFILKLKKK